jgi:hypothetical protein
MNVYRAIQVSIIVTLMAGWIITGYICLTTPEPSDWVSQTYSKLEAIFFTLASLKSLEIAIQKANGGNGNDKTTPAPDNTPAV